MKQTFLGSKITQIFMLDEVQFSRENTILVTNSLKGKQQKTKQNQNPITFSLNIAKICRILCCGSMCKEIKEMS